MMIIVNKLINKYWRDISNNLVAQTYFYSRNSLKPLALLDLVARFTDTSLFGVNGFIIGNSFLFFVSKQKFECLDHREQWF